MASWSQVTVHRGTALGPVRFWTVAKHHCVTLLAVSDTNILTKWHGQWLKRCLKHRDNFMKHGRSDQKKLNPVHE